MEAGELTVVLSAASGAGVGYLYTVPPVLFAKTSLEASGASDGIASGSLEEPQAARDTTIKTTNNTWPMLQPYLLNRGFKDISISTSFFQVAFLYLDTTQGAILSYILHKIYGLRYCLPTVRVRCYFNSHKF